MAISLQKGGNISLTKSDPGIKVALAGLGWEARSTTGDDFDLDASALLIGANGKVRSDADFIFYNQPQSSDGSVVYGGDNRTGAGDGDDETVVTDLTSVPADVEKIVFTASIYDADKRNQSFGQVRNAYIRVVNNETGSEIVRYDLTEEYASETALVFGELYRYNGEWKFRAVGQGYSTGLAGIARDFGVNVG